MNAERLDLLLQYAILVAAQNDDWQERDLGPIHLIKYAYLGDLAHARRLGGVSFSDAEWQFYHYGPWSTAVFERIEPAMYAVGAAERRWSTPRFEDDVVRFRADTDEDVLRDIERSVPLAVRAAMRRHVLEFGKDTALLLSYVYRTRPMLRAAPGELLDLSVVAEPALVTRDVVEPPAERSKKAENRRAQKIGELRERVQSILADRQESHHRVPPLTEPRYDDVFARGQEWIDGLAGPPLEEGDAEAVFSEEIWRSRGREEAEDS